MGEGASHAETAVLADLGVAADLDGVEFVAQAVALELAAVPAHPHAGGVLVGADVAEALAHVIGEDLVEGNGGHRSLLEGGVHDAVLSHLAAGVHSAGHEAFFHAGEGEFNAIELLFEGFDIAAKGVVEFSGGLGLHSTFNGLTFDLGVHAGEHDGSFVGGAFDGAFACDTAIDGGGAADFKGAIVLDVVLAVSVRVVFESGIAVEGHCAIGGVVDSAAFTFGGVVDELHSTFKGGSGGDFGGARASADTNHIVSAVGDSAAVYHGMVVFKSDSAAGAEGQVVIAVNGTTALGSSVVFEDGFTAFGKGDTVGRASIACLVVHADSTAVAAFVVFKNVFTLEGQSRAVGSLDGAAAAFAYIAGESAVFKLGVAGVSEIDGATVTAHIAGERGIFDGNRADTMSRQRTAIVRFIFRKSRIVDGQGATISKNRTASHSRVDTAVGVIFCNIFAEGCISDGQCGGAIDGTTAGVCRRTGGDSDFVASKLGAGDGVFATCKISRLRTPDLFLIGHASDFRCTSHASAAKHEHGGHGERAEGVDEVAVSEHGLVAIDEIANSTLGKHNVSPKVEVSPGATRYDTELF